MRFSVLTFVVLLTGVPCAAQAPGGDGQANYVVGPEDVLSVTVFNEAQLSGRYQPRLTGAVHAATACRNSSERVGGS